jgi:hypothetical protein
VSGRKEHAISHGLIESYRSSTISPAVKGVGPGLASVLPSPLVISFLSPATFALLIVVASLASLVGCKCDTLKSPYWLSHCCFFRVLMLRRKASPTETELHVEYSHMVNEALEMVPVEVYPGEISRVSKPFSTDAQAQA